MKKKVIIALGSVLVLTGAAAWLTAAPTIGATTLMPASIEVGTTAPVTVTALITDSSVIPTGVNLLRVGTTTTVLGQLKDDGLNGDAKAGDKIFTARVNIAGQVVGEVRLQVSAAFKGVLARVTSVPILLAVAPKGVVLPPDPGQAGKQTVAGIDSDRDGVRDDLQRYIAFTYPTAPVARAALLQDAKATQSFLLTASANKDAVYAHSLDVLNAKYCVFSRLGRTAGMTAHQLLRAELLNTHARSLAYIAADKQLSGKIFPAVPDTAWASLCQF